MIAYKSWNGLDCHLIQVLDMAEKDHLIVGTATSIR